MEGTSRIWEVSGTGEIYVAKRAAGKGFFAAARSWVDREPTGPCARGFQQVAQDHRIRITAEAHSPAAGMSIHYSIDGGKRPFMRWLWIFQPSCPLLSGALGGRGRAAVRCGVHRGPSLGLPGSAQSDRATGMIALPVVGVTLGVWLTRPA